MVVKAKAKAWEVNREAMKEDYRSALTKFWKTS